MITEIIVVYNNPETKALIEDIDFPFPIYVDYLDRGSKLSRKKARELMEDWGATQYPFIVIKDCDKVTKCLYTEDGDKVINDLKNIIENETF